MVVYVGICSELVVIGFFISLFCIFTGSPLFQTISEFIEVIKIYYPEFFLASVLFVLAFVIIHSIKESYIHFVFKMLSFIGCVLVYVFVINTFIINKKNNQYHAYNKKNGYDKEIQISIEGLFKNVRQRTLVLCYKTSKNDYWEERKLFNKNEGIYYSSRFYLAIPKDVTELKIKYDIYYDTYKDKHFVWVEKEKKLLLDNDSYSHDFFYPLGINSVFRGFPIIQENSQVYLFTVD